MSAIDELKAVLLDHEGNVSIKGSDEDKKIISRTLKEIGKQLGLLVYDAIRTRTESEPLGKTMADCFDKIIAPDLARHLLKGNQQRKEYDYTKIENRIRMRLNMLADDLPHLTADELELVEEDLDRCARIAKLFADRKQPIVINEQPAPTVAGHKRRTAPHGQVGDFDGTANNPIPLTTDIDTINFAGLIKMADKLGVPHDEDRWIDDEYPDKTDDLRVAVADAAEKAGK